MTDKNIDEIVNEIDGHLSQDVQSLLEEPEVVINNQVYNPTTTALKIRSKNYIQDIISGNKIAHELSEYLSLYKELLDIIAEYDAIYRETHDETDRKNLEAYLSEKADYLDVILPLMQSLDYHYKKVTFTNYEEEQKRVFDDWKCVRSIVTYRNLQVEQRQIAKMLQDTLRNDFADIQLKNAGLLHTMDDSKVVYLNSLEKMKNIAMANDQILEVETESEIEEVPVSKKNDEYTIDETYYNGLKLEQKANYLLDILERIEKIHGRKKSVKVDGETVYIARKYASRYQSYASMLRNVERELDEIIDVEIQEVQATEEVEKHEMSQAEQELYNTYTSDLNKIQKQILGLAKEGIGEVNPERLVEITIPTGQKISILKSRLGYYDELHQTLKEKSEKVFEIEKKYGLATEEERPVIPEYLEEANQIRRQELIEDILFLKGQGKSPELDEKVKELRKQLYALNKGKKLFMFANLKDLFMSSGLSEEISNYYAKVATNPFKFVHSKKVKDVEKKNIFKSIIEKLMTLGEKEEDKLETNETPKENKKFDVSGTLKNISLVIRNFPKVASRCLEIRKVRKSKNPKQSKAQIKKKAANIAAILGMTAILGATASYGNGMKQSNVKHDDQERSISTEESTSINVDTEVDANEIAQSIIKENFNGTLPGMNPFYTGNLAKPESPFESKDKNISNDVGNVVYEPTNTNLDYSINDVEKERNSNITAGVTAVMDEVLQNTLANKDAVSDEASKEAEAARVDFGDRFTKELDEIFATSDDAYADTNVQDAYFDTDSFSQVTGITYDFNGTSVFISATDPDREAKMTALENQGAKQVAVRAENEAAVGHEGFYRIDNIQVESEGRGR